jgi:hypothetical protein
LKQKLLKQKPLLKLHLKKRKKEVKKKKAKKVVKKRKQLRKKKHQKKKKRQRYSFQDQIMMLINTSIEQNHLEINSMRSNSIHS